MQHRNLYFIAIIPPPEIVEEIRAFQQDMATRFGSSKALRVIPHITLKAPFAVETDQPFSFVKLFEQKVTDEPPFVQELNGFGAFPNYRNPVIFVRPALNPNLQKLQKSVLHWVQQQVPKAQMSQTERNFHPHITIAYRDLTFPAFTGAWNEYENKDYKALFVIQHIHLLFHTGGQWEVVASQPMLSSTGE